MTDGDFRFTPPEDGDDEVENAMNQQLGSFKLCVSRAYSVNSEYIQ